MKFYTVEDSYIAHLKATDSNVPDNYSGKRPFIGVILEVNSLKYIAPLTSYKPKQDKIKSSQPTVFKVHERTDPDNKLGMVQINNMIPVLDSVIELLNMEGQPQPYRSMLYKQYEFLKQNADELTSRAEKLYELVNNGHTFYSRISCKFKELEEASKAFNS
ncbi:type III toxin-antitoxin system ToxN/AbiQ family toxin [Saccharophagus degradans]|uniref:type III toxin-antitoxin system ToxN/AbiQ family toxin n=1 Tax=Saccharophagus degradans TaxID=86304 RepID=UPI002477DA6D|nr:type III toxin-antitoxin system ToxN/AbiQ family toxin [Saccharophagus degradans]WGO99788.1 type III toxin-antitoxin system ToxN/AbiQ family toxin [Saccharophagus degradans]